MSDNQVGYRKAGDVEVSQALLISQVGQIIDIEPLILEINFYQSLHEHYMQCDIVVSDALSLIDDLKGDRQKGIQGGFNGGEVFILKYNIRDKDVKDQIMAFGLYELSDRQRLNEKVETYILSGISLEAYGAAVKKISRAYGPNQISQMVRSVVSEYVATRPVQDMYRQYREITNARIEKEVNIAETTGLQKFVIPNLSVDATLDFFAKEADCQGHVPLFLFYETFSGFNFQDLNNLVQQDYGDKRFVYLPTNVNEDKAETEERYRDHSKIISYSVVKQSNILQNAQEGLFRSQVFNLDILRKKNTKVDFNYQKEHPKFNTLQKHKVPGDVTGNPVLFMMQSRSGHDQDTLFSNERPYPKKINQFIARSTSYERHIFNVVLDVIIPGDPTINVGDVIYLEIPNATTLKDKDGQEDKYLSGKYVITKIRNQIKEKNLMTTFIECAKDTGIDI